MNVPSQMAGNMPNQGGTSRMVQQNGGIGVGSGGAPGWIAISNMDHEFVMVRRMIQSKITQYIQGHRQAVAILQKIPDIAKHIEIFLLKNAPSQEDYMNPETLDIRLQTVVKNLMNYQSRRTTSSPSVNSMIQTPGGSNMMQNHGGSNMMQTPGGSTMIPTPGSGTMIPTPGSRTMIPTPGVSTMIPTPGVSTMIPTPGGSTMIPTPGMSRTSNINSTVTCSADNSVVATSGSGTLTATPVGSVNMLQISNGAASIGHRMMHDSYQLPITKNSFSSVPPMSISHNPSQMIPTPGLNNMQSTAMNSVCNGGGYSGVESTVVSQQQHQKQSAGNQNIRILQNLGGQMGIGLRSNIPHRYGFSNGGLTSRGNNQQLMNGSVVSEAYMSSPAYNNSQKPMQKHLDHQLQQSLRPRDGFGMNNMTGNLYVNTPSGGSAVNHPNMNSLNRSKISTASQNYQLNLQSNQQQMVRNSSFVDHSQKMEFQSHAGRENLLQPTQQFQTQTSQPSAQFVQNQFQPQKQLSLESDPFQQPFLASGLGAQGIDSFNEPLNAQASQEFRLPELSGYPNSNMVVSSSMGTKLVGQLPVSQNSQPSISQDSQKLHQIFDHSQPAVESLNNFNSLSNGCQSDVFLPGHWHHQTLEKHHSQDKTSLQQHIHNDFSEPPTDQADEKHVHFPTEVSGPTSNVANGISVIKPPSDIVPSNDINALRAVHFTHQQKWILLMIHSRYCSFPVGKCNDIYCSKAQDLWLHMISCNEDDCKHSRCKKSKKLIEHFCKCQLTDCPTCVPVRFFITSKYRTHSCDADRGEMNDSRKAVNAVDDLKSIETSGEMQALKRVKVEHSSFKNDSYSTSSQQSQIQSHPLADSVISMDCEPINTNAGPIIGSGSENLPNMSKCNIAGSDNKLFMPGECQPKSEAIKLENDSKPLKFEIKQDITAPSVDHIPTTKSGKPKIKGVSMTELFTPELVQMHITGLRQWVGQSKAKAEKNQAMEHSMSENSCQLCAIEKLTFEPPPIYCSICGARIKRNATYYTCGSSDTRQYLCIPCHNEARGDTVEVEGAAIIKSRFEKKKNDVEIEESWVQCDKCEAWQHQICTLFNGRRNEGGQAEYICPKCYVDDVNNGIRKPLPQSSVLGADDLPKTLLSDHLEERLFMRLKQDRHERAMIMGKSYDQVPGAEALVVRVVSSVDKKLDVKQRFLEIFQEDNYPKEFAYKSKVVLLFQKIEGVEVCLFGMYVQEFGSECAFPNQRRVYLSYLDSVKYFRPEIKTASGEALRTFVYHEILIGYLEYCKMRGFTSCYIWACPPLKGEDYILYCHPEIQKTPKSDKLREWYLSMLRKAMKENIVVDLTNLYDHFFVTTGECKAKVTAARLPYFDGDYWPGAAEDMINLLQQEEDGRRQQKKGKTKKTITKRALKAAGQTDLSGNASKDALLMQKLGETISPMKEDFIMVHLQHACTHCCILMVSGIRWVCNHCKNFQLCERCYDAEQKREEREKHPINSREKHHLNPVAITGVSPDTSDDDDILESEFFDTRQAFLSLCQGNHYQYDTLRRAKHSSMMVLYHLHNPTAPAFVTTCNVCHHDIETGQGWRCEVCPDFDVCSDCHKKDGVVDHPHKLTNHPSMVDAQNSEARQIRVAQLRGMLNLLVHASQCRGAQSQSSQCQYPNCCKVKGLFRHGRVCKTRMSGGCIVCKRMWYLLQLHSRACKDPECSVPRCRDLREHLRRSQQQSESRRRAAVNEMMRQRAAEVAGSS